MCKWFAARVARIHSGEAVQVLGSFGLDEDCKTERFYRDAKTMEIAGGTSELQKMILVTELDI
jgi:alkylation response protein AidB-like acyl-CoA dehydrogenase